MPPRDRRSIRYDQFARRQRRWPKLVAWTAIPLVLLAGAAAGGYVVMNHGKPDAIDTTTPAALIKASGPTANETYRWAHVAIGGGGFVTGLSMDPAGKTFVVRTDVYGAYIWDAGANRWRQLVTAEAMPAGEAVQGGMAQGAYEVVVAPSKPDRIYLAIKGKVYRSDDRGAHFAAAQSGPFPLKWDTLGDWRLAGPYMAVDPANPDLVLLGTPSDGLWRSADAGRSWQRVASMPDNKANGTPSGLHGPGSQIWFAPATGGKPDNRVFAFASGQGMFVSTDKGATFSALPASGDRPLTVRRGAFLRDGSFLAADESSKAFWLYRDGRWRNLVQEMNLIASQYIAVASDLRTGRILVSDQAGSGYLSRDDGKSWSSITHSARVGEGDPPWLKAADLPFFASADIQFDPAHPDKVWLAQGTGVFYADLVGGDTNLAWVSQARGIEELVANDVVQAPGHAPVFSAYDFGIHVKHDLGAFSTRFGPGRNFIAAQQADWTPADTSFLVTNASDTRDCCADDGNAVMAGFSTDGGNSWSKFASLPTPPGTDANDPWRMSFGTIAVSSGDADNIVWAPAFNRTPFYTKNRGRSWEPVVLPGASGDNPGSFPVKWVQRKTLAADKAAPGVFYLAHSGDAPNPQLAGLWRSSDGGASWEHVYGGELAPNSGQAAKLRAVPGKAGHLFFTSATVAADTRLRRSTDGGKTWTTLDTVTRVDDVAFGKAAAGASYPAIYISGQVGGAYGVWRSTDNAASWQQLAGFPVGTLDQVTSMAADPDVFGRVYLGYQGSGWIWGEPAACRPAMARAPALDQCVAVRR